MRRTSSLPARFLRTAVVLAAAAASACPNGRADVVYLKDGFALNGRVRREDTLIFDPVTGVAVPVNKGSFFIVDDRVRWVLFGHRYVDNANPNVDTRSDFVQFTNPLFARPTAKMPKKAVVRKFHPITDKWERRVDLSAVYDETLGAQPMVVEQRLTSLTPYALRLESKRYQWNASYLTREFDAEALRGLLDSHKDLQEANGPDIDKRMTRFRFWLQSDMLLEADKELDHALADLPGEKERIEKARAGLRQAQVRAMWDEVQLAHRAGRDQFVRDFFHRLPVNEIDARLLTEVN